MNFPRLFRINSLYYNLPIIDLWNLAMHSKNILGFSKELLKEFIQMLPQEIFQAVISEIHHVSYF